MIDLVWRCVHKCPRLTFDQKVDRINWCTANLNTIFFNYWFADETSVWENECPKYAYRPKGSSFGPIGVLQTLIIFSDLKSFIIKQMCANLDEFRAAIALYRMNLSNQKIASFIHHLHQAI